jgi:hypothetical protein
VEAQIFPFAHYPILRDGSGMEPVMPRDTGLDARFEAELRAAVPGWRSGPGGIRHEPDAGRFVEEDPHGDCVLEYHRAGDEMVITHTFVPEALRGAGRAGELVRAVLDVARREKRTVRAECSYVAAWLARHPGEL